MTWLLREMSLPHLARHRARTALTVVGIALGIGALVASQGVTGAVVDSFRRMVEATAGRADLEIGNGGVGVPEALVEEVRGLAGVAAASPLVQGFVPIRDGRQTLAVFGVDILADEEHEAQVPRSAVELPDQLVFVSRPDSIALARTFAVAHGLDLDANVDVVAPAGPRTLVVRGFLNDNLAARSGLGRGDAIVLDTASGERRFPVLGVFSDFQIGVIGGVALSRALLERAWHDDQVSRILVWTRPDADVAAVQADIERRYGTTHDLHAITARQLRGTIAGILDDAFSGAHALALVSLLIAAVGVTNFLLARVLDRRGELATLTALGVPARQIGRSVVAEGLVVGSVGAGVGLVAAIVVSRLVVLRCSALITGWRLTYELPVGTVLALCAATVVLAGTAGLLPARAALRRASLAMEEST